MAAFRVTGNQYNCNLRIKLPYQWLPLDKKPSRIPFGVVILNSKQETVGSGIIDLDPRDVKVDGNQLPQKMMSDLFSGDGDDEGFGMGDLIGGLLGGESTTARMVCNSCDGMGLCPECYGDAFFDPAVCRRCSQDPGICRRCKGNKKESVRLDY